MKRLSFSILIGVCLTIIIQVTLIGSRLMPPRQQANPLWPYDAIRPGLPDGVLDAYGCRLLYYLDTANVNSYICEITPESEMIEGITVSVEQNRVRSIAFRTHGLHLNDLMEAWGRPDLTWHFRSSSHALWNSGMRATIQASGWYSMQSEVKHLLIQ
jgi:hypothetical protein